MRRLLIAAVWVLASSGCASTPPTLSGGKPTSYWVEVLHGPDPKLRKNAVFKLGNVGPTDAGVLPALIEALKDRDAAVRREAIIALMKCGREGQQAVPTLTDLQEHDGDAGVRAYAARALEKLKREAAVRE